MDDTDLTETIAENAAGPKRVKGDMGEVEQQSIADQIAADKYLAAKSAAKSKRRGLRFNRLIPPGTC